MRRRVISFLHSAGEADTADQFPFFFVREEVTFRHSAFPSQRQFCTEEHFFSLQHAAEKSQEE